MNYRVRRQGENMRAFQITANQIFRSAIEKYRRFWNPVLTGL
jgi:hypothetical protein